MRLLQIFGITTLQDSQGIPSGANVQGPRASYTGPQIKGAADLGFVETPWGRYKRYRMYFLVSGIKLFKFVVVIFTK